MFVNENHKNILSLYNNNNVHIRANKYHVYMFHNVFYVGLATQILMCVFKIWTLMMRSQCKRMKISLKHYLYVTMLGHILGSR